jgi:hypothetical protein
VRFGSGKIRPKMENLSEFCLSVFFFLILVLKTLSDAEIAVAVGEE